MKKIKPLIVNEIVRELKDVKAGVFINYQALTAEEINVLRRNLAEKNIKMRVYKNSSFRFALKELKLGVETEGIDPEAFFSKPTALIFSDQYPEPVETAKAFSEWRKAEQKQTIAVKGGFYGERLISMEEVQQYVNLPSKDQLIAGVVGGIASPLTGFMGVLSGVIRDFVLILKAFQEKQEEKV